jgi:gamma-glutamylcysteine synthetase
MSLPDPCLLSTELECPVVSLRDGRPAPPELFAAVWETLGADAWSRGDFGVERERRLVPRTLCISTAQAMTTDTGPTIELVPSPGRSLAAVAGQLDGLVAEASAVLDGLGYAMLGSGVHPTLRAVPADYYRYRTPRPSYDYVIGERCWHHWSIVNVASVQEIVDVSFDDAPRAVRVLHRLAGLMNFMLRNDPDLLGDYDGQLSVRPRAWREHVPPSAPFAGDAGKVCLPAREVEGWQDYLSLLWEASPMFLVGTKNGGAAYVPQHPTFLRFLQQVPAEGWPARTLSGETIRIFPEPVHIEKTDWTYMGFARIRWKWRQDADGVARFLEAWRCGEIEGFLRANVLKVVIENRCNSAQPPGETLVSLALVAGLLANLDQAEELALGEPYSFWLSVLTASTTEPMDAHVAGRSIAEYARRMVDVARRGLVRRGEPSPEQALGPLYGRIEGRRSPAEDLLREYRQGGVEALLRCARIGVPSAERLRGSVAQLVPGA